MQPQLQEIEVKLVIFDDDNLAIEHAFWQQYRAQRRLQFRKITIERLFVPALDENLITITKHQRAKSVPLGLKDPIITFGQFSYTLRQHRENGWIDGKVHG